MPGCYSSGWEIPALALVILSVGREGAESPLGARAGKDGTFWEGALSSQSHVSLYQRAPPKDSFGVLDPVGKGDNLVQAKASWWCLRSRLPNTAASKTRAQALTFAQIQFSRRSHLVNTQPAALDTALRAGFAPGFGTQLCLPACAFNFRAVTVCANGLWRREVSLSSSENKKANLFRDVSSYGWWIKFTLSLKKMQTLNHLVKKGIFSWDTAMAWKNPPSSLIELEMYLGA